MQRSRYAKTQSSLPFLSMMLLCATLLGCAEETSDDTNPRTREVESAIIYGERLVMQARGNIRAADPQPFGDIEAEQTHHWLATALKSRASAWIIGGPRGRTSAIPPSLLSIGRVEIPLPDEWSSERFTNNYQLNQVGDCQKIERSKLSGTMTSDSRMLTAGHTFYPYAPHDTNDSCGTIEVFFEGWRADTPHTPGLFVSDESGVPTTPDPTEFDAGDDFWSGMDVYISHEEESPFLAYRLYTLGLRAQAETSFAGQDARERLRHWTFRPSTDPRENRALSPIWTTAQLINV